MSKTAIALLISLALASAQPSTSCVKIVNSTDNSPYSLEEPSLTFTMDGVTNFETNNVNIALVVDGSGSINSTGWDQEQTFAKRAVAAFARRNVFENGGSASYVQFSSPLDMGTSYSEEEFDAHVNSLNQYGGGTDIVNGMQAGAELMSASPASFNIMILITDGAHGYSSYGGDPAATAVKIRGDGRTTIFVVGVGEELQQDELEGIAGGQENVFPIDGFEALVATLDEIELSVESSLSCNATNVEIYIEFSIPVSSVASPGAAITADNRVTFTAVDLEDNPTQFSVGLEGCGEVLSVEYKDEQGNTPDFSSLPEPTCFEFRTEAAAAASIAVVSAGVLAVLVNMVTVGPIGIGASSPNMVQDSLIVTETGQQAPGSALEPGGDPAVEKRPGNQGDQKSATGKDDSLDGDASREHVVTDAEPSSGIAGEKKSAADELAMSNRESEVFADSEPESLCGRHGYEI